MQLNKSELVSCLVKTFGRDFNLTDFDLDRGACSVRFTLDGNRFSVSCNGFVESVVDSFVRIDLPAKLVGLALRPTIDHAVSMKLAT